MLPGVPLPESYARQGKLSNLVEYLFQMCMHMSVHGHMLVLLML